MDELDRFRSFRSAAAPAGAGAAAGARAAVAVAVEREQARGRGRLPRRRRALAGALALAAAAIAVALVAPWSGGPSLVDRAAAAITQDSNTVLHQRVEISSTDLATGAVLGRRVDELWLDGAPPHRYRTFFQPPFTSKTLEVGGTSASLRASVYRPATNTFDTHSLQLEVTGMNALDTIRQALASGAAVAQGTARLDGRQVLKFLVRGSGPEGTDELYYVDPQTYDPVEIDGQGFLVDGPKRYHVATVERFLTFELLPRTQANLRLTDIQAMHPSATNG